MALCRGASPPTPTGGYAPVPPQTLQGVLKLFLEVNKSELFLKTFKLFKIVKPKKTPKKQKKIQKTLKKH